MFPENDYRYYLEHSAKGSTWKDHKYLEKINGVYIYTKEQLAKVKNAATSKFYSTSVGKAYDAKQQEKNAEKQKKEIKKEFDSLKYLGVSDSTRNKVLKKARKEIKKAVNSKYDTSIKTKLTTAFYKSKLGKAYDAKMQQKRAANQRAAAKASLPTESERKKILKNAGYDANKIAYQKLEKAYNNAKRPTLPSVKSAAKNTWSKVNSAYDNLPRPGQTKKKITGYKSTNSKNGNDRVASSRSLKSAKLKASANLRRARQAKNASYYKNREPR